ncbi:hypothetical protein DMN91_004861, partial [Ooceraea biroi]
DLCQRDKVMGSVSLDPQSMENNQERILLDGGSCTSRLSKQNQNQSSTTSQHQVNVKTHYASKESEIWCSLQSTISNCSARDGDEYGKEKDCAEYFEILKFPFPKKVKAYGGRKTNASKRRVTFADH